LISVILNSSTLPSGELIKGRKEIHSSLTIVNKPKTNPSGVTLLAYYEFYLKKENLKPLYIKSILAPFYY